MITKHEFIRFYHKKRLLERLVKGGLSISKLHLGAGMNRILATAIIDEMEDENLVKVVDLGRMRWNTITKSGRLYLKEFKRFCNIIEILNNEETG